MQHVSPRARTRRGPRADATTARLAAPQRFSTLSSLRRSRLQASVEAFVPLGAWLARLAFIGGGVAAGCLAVGCGDDVVCPTGTAGSPCRYVEGGAGDPPALLPHADVNGADALDGDAVLDTQVNGDIETLDGAEMNDGPDTTPDSDEADDSGDDADTGPGDARSDSDGEARAIIETPDVLPPATCHLASGRSAVVAAVRPADGSADHDRLVPPGGQRDHVLPRAGA